MAISVAVNLRRQNELYTNRKGIQQIEFVEQRKNIDGINAYGAESMFVLTILEKNQRNKIKIFPGKCNSIIKMPTYQQA